MRERPRVILSAAVLLAAPCLAQRSLNVLSGPNHEPYTSSSDVQADALLIGSTPAWGVPIQVASRAPWLTFDNGCPAAPAGLSVASGVTPLALNFCVYPSKVANDGYYAGIIEVAATGYPTLRVPIKLTKFPVGDLTAIPDALSLDGSHLSASVVVDVDPTGQDNNNGGFSQHLGFATSLGLLSPAEGDWLSFSQKSTTTPAQVIISADPSRISSQLPGTYANTIVFTDTYHNVKTATVTLAVQAQDLSQVRALPHIAVGGSWKTGFFAVNNASQPGQFTIRFYGDDGSSIAVPIAGLGSQSVLSDVVPAQGANYYEAGDPRLPLQPGWALVTADPSVTVQALFRNNAGGGRYYEAGVPWNAGGSGFVIPFDATTFADTGAPFYTGFAVASLDSAVAANVTCTARDGAGNVIPNAVSVPLLSPLGHYAGYLFPALAGKRGTVSCSANTRIAALALRFIGNDAFSSLPVLTLP